MIELAAPRAGDVGDEPIEDTMARFVLVQAEVEEMTEKAAGLRHAEDVRPLELGGAGVAVGRRGGPEPRGGVAHGEEAEADEGRMLRAVHELVDLARLEVTVEADAGRAGEPPRRPRDGHGGSTRVLADGQACGRVREVGGRVREVIAVGHRQGRDARVGPPLAGDRPADGPVPVPRRRHREGHQPVLPRDVVLPAAPPDRVAPAHEEAVAEVLGRRRVGHPWRAVEHAERDLAAAIRDVEEEAAVAARRIAGPQDIEIRVALDQTRGAAGCCRQIGDGLVRRVRRMDAEAEHAHDLFVRAGRPEWTTVEHRRTLRDLERGHGHWIDPSFAHVIASP